MRRSKIAVVATFVWVGFALLEGLKNAFLDFSIESVIGLYSALIMSSVFIGIYLVLKELEKNE